MKEIDEEEQKLIQIGILKETMKICKENNLICFLGGGTLLGAIRHNGYIPWDDDIDVMMPRKDYEKLLEVFNSSAKKEYKLLSYKNTKGYYYSFNKIVNVKTKMLENEYREIEEMGVYIDVFPIDFLPNDKRTTEKLFRYYKSRDRIVNRYKAQNLKEMTRSKFKLLIKNVVNFIVGKECILKTILKQMDEAAKKYNNTEKVACISGRYMEKEIMPASYIADFKLVKFEGEEYYAPIGYEEYLKKHYGEYMKLPPKEQQVKSHNNVAYWK